MYNILICDDDRDIVEALPAAMEKYGIQDLNEIIGGAH